jgi:hypothetical protein
MQNAYASYQSMQFIGRLSPLPAMSVHVWRVASHFTNVVSSAALAGRLAFHAMSQPGSLALLGFLPAPAAVIVCEYAATNFRNLPTVIS